MALRIQRRRTKGWRMPARARYVGRPTKWGNPCYLDAEGRPFMPDGREIILDGIQFLAGPKRPLGRGRAVMLAEGFRRWIAERVRRPLREAAKAELRGRDLACWCPLDQACHADVLLNLANR